MHGKGYGMPSSHAQFVSFFSISLTLFLLLRHTPPKRATESHTPLKLWERVALSGVVLANAALVSWSRTYLSYHTSKQVLVGCAAGSITAVLWFLATTVLRRTGLLGWFLEHPFARLFRLRDLVVEEDLSQAGWEKWESKRGARLNAKSSGAAGKKPKVKAR